LNSQLIDFDYIPRYIQDRVMDALPVSIKRIIPSNFRPHKIQLGLCCINTKLRKHDIFCSRTMILRTIREKGIEELKHRALKNVLDLIKLIEWNAANGIRVLRMSSDIFPHKGNQKAPDYTFDFAHSALVEAGRLARKYKQRLTFHPGQYNVVATPDEDKFQRTCVELEWHAIVMDRMGCD